jgi:hypothetical protein
MIEKQRNNAFVIGTYKLTDGPVHALTTHDNPHQHEAPLKTVCGSFLRVHYASPFNSPIERNGLSSVTCKRCLRILEQKGLLRIKKDKSTTLLGTYRHGAKSIILRGTYKYGGFCPVHALVKREPRPSDNPAVGIAPLRSLCKAYPDVYRPNEPPHTYSHSALASRITCKKCLEIMKKTGMLLEKDFPAMIKTKKSVQKKFFLVFYDGGTVDNIYDFDELLQDVDRFKPNINKILLIESYKKISVKNIAVVTDENGKEITKESL